MSIMPVYSSNIENYCIYGAIGFFIVFLLFIIVRKTASAKDSYTRVNRIHSRILLLYLICLICTAIYLNELNSKFFISIAVGIFIYLSLHYVFIFALIGVCQKSISVRILAAGQLIEKHGHAITLQKLTEQMHENEFDIDNLRKSRLWQMTHLGFATSVNGTYLITNLGRVIDHIGTVILKIYGLKRL